MEFTNEFLRLTMNFKPLHDRVLVKPIEQDEKTIGGIIIPDSAKEKPSKGEIMAVGGGARSSDGTIQNMEVKVGDKVLYGKWAGTEVNIDGQNLMIMKESDIMGIIN